MWHSKVSEAPAESSDFAEQSIGISRACGVIISCTYVKKSRKSLEIIRNSAKSACCDDSIGNNEEKSDCHYDGLDKVCFGSSEESAGSGITYDDYCRYDHCQLIIYTKQ